jgi:ATP-dependent DNA helicase RecQ
LTSFKIDEKKYLEDKGNAQKRLNAVINFFSSDNCRQKVILEYFDEEAKACGRCDICRGSQTSDYTFEDKKEVINYLSNMKTKSFYGSKVAAHWPLNRRKRIIKVIEDLLDEGYIEFVSKDLYISLLND